MAKSRALFSVLFLILAPAALITGDGVAYIALYALLLLFAFALASAVLASLLIKVEEHAEKRRFFKNEEIPYTVKIYGKLFFLYSGVRLDMYTDGFVAYDPVREEISPDGFFGEYILRFPYRGSYLIGVKSVSVTDFMGLFRIPFPVKKAAGVIAYPEKDEKFSLILHGGLLNKSAGNLDMFDYADADVSDVRKYDPSDDYRKIHWKLTAKRGEFIVKNYHAAVLNKTTVLLDPSASSLKGERKAAFDDRVASLAATVLDALVSRRLPAELVCGNGAVRVGSLSELYAAFQILAELDFAGSGAMEQMLANTVSPDAGMFNLLVIITGMGKPLFARLREMLLLGHGMTVFYVPPSGGKPSGEKEDFLNNLRLLGADVNILDA